MLCPTTPTAMLAVTGKTLSRMLFSRDLHIFSIPETISTLVVYLPITLDQLPTSALGSAVWTLSGQSALFTK